MEIRWRKEIGRFCRFTVLINTQWGGFIFAGYENERARSTYSIVMHIFKFENRTNHDEVSGDDVQRGTNECGRTAIELSVFTKRKKESQNGQRSKLLFRER